ncbi:Protein apaG [Monoraphidium neglectum]|uniref:Protein apaG n=1 Tax=Monoraphidium neglectum TaxID=145388 RepID=A0A0D2MT22_9CHLO|nr:Protein apaG [Monoraphidium neglectum]KIZ05675.1 Protein apaG [Monoraphidium neglectum]|eukprot:XP_013904694.1 Protein apaG [Monoraphidium neglectum]
MQAQHSPTGYQLECLDAAVPGLEEVPSSFPLDRPALARLIKANFRAHRDTAAQLSDGYTALDQGFAALRAIPEQLYLEQCSSSSNAEGVIVDVTSKWMGTTEEPPTGEAKHAFSYRVRVTNARSSPIQVLGRSWEIFDANSALVGHIPLSPENAIVGQQPVIPPGRTFEYVSGSVLSTPSGTMRGRLAVAELRGLQQWRRGEDWFKVPIAPFMLVRPQSSGGG